MLKNNALNSKAITCLSLSLFAFVAFFFNGKCSPLYLFNEWCDPNIYFSIGKGIFNGKIPYKDLFDHKGPLIFFIYGIGYKISNTTFFGIYILESFALAICFIFIYKLAKLFLTRPLSYIIAILYSLLFFSKSGTGGSADEFMAPAIIISMYYFVTYSNNKCKINNMMFIQGITFAFVFLIKFSAILFWIPLILAIFYKLFIQKQYKQISICILCFLCGFTILLLPFLLYFIINSAIPEAYYAYFKFNAIYAKTTISIDTILNLIARFIKFAFANYIALPLVLIGVAYFSFSKKYITENIYRIGFLFSFILLYLPIANSRDHHQYAYIVLYVFAIIGLISIFDHLNKYIDKYKDTLSPKYVALFSTLILIIGIYNQHLFDEEKNQLLRKTENSSLQREFAKKINEEINPTLLDLGLDKGIYTAANIVPQYKYFFHPAIREDDFPEIRQYQIELIKKGEPMFIVTPNNNFPYLSDKYEQVACYLDVYLFKLKAGK